MPSDFLWYLPTHGDGRDLATGAFHPGQRGSAFRPPTLDYLKQVALAAERAGFLGALIPTGTHCEDAWAVAAAVSQHATRLKPLVAFRPGFVLPAVAAQTAASLQRLTNGRLLLNVVLAFEVEPLPRVHVITRDSSEEAWAEATRLLERIPPGAIEEAQRQFAATESVGQARQVGLHGGKPKNVRDLEVYPNLWAGVGLVRGGAGTAIVGSHEEVAERFAEYESVGIDTFILSAYPNLEEAVRVGEDLLPRLERSEPRASR